MTSSSEKVLIQSWVPRQLAERVRARARAAERSVAGELRYLLADLDEPSTESTSSTSATTTTQETTR